MVTSAANKALSGQEITAGNVKDEDIEEPVRLQLAGALCNLGVDAKQGLHNSTDVTLANTNYLIWTTNN